MKRKKQRTGTFSISSLSSTQRRALELLLSDPSVRHSIRGLAKVLVVNPGSLSRELLKLAEKGLLVSHQVGRAKQYSANIAHPLYDDLKAVFRKEFEQAHLEARSLPGGLHIGQPITANHIQLITSSWSPQEFARLGNSLIWAVVGSKSQIPPSLSERVYAADQGVDAECQYEVPDTTHPHEPLLSPGLNVYQYKLRSVIGQQTGSIVSRLATDITQQRSLEQVTQARGRPPARYVLFTNLDLTLRQKQTLRDSLRRSSRSSDRTLIEVLGAAELAAMLNNAPHIRSAFFGGSGFSTWEAAWNRHATLHRFGATIDLVGRDEELKRLSTAVDNPEVRSIVVAGPSEIGKTRLVLEATRGRQHDVVVVHDPRTTKPTDISALGRGDGEVLVIVDDPDEEDIKAFVYEALSKQGVKIILTVPTRRGEGAPEYGDKRVVTSDINPLTPGQSEELLKATGKHLDFGLASWIIAQAGGIPGVLLSAANIAETLRDTAGDFAEHMARAYQDAVERELGSDALHALRLLSVLSHVGISGRSATEIKVICELLGDGFGYGKVLDNVPPLLQSGFLKASGSFVEVTLPILASQLVGQLIPGREARFLGLFVRLESSARTRFLRRLSGLTDQHASIFWEQLFGVEGPFWQPSAAYRNTHALRRIAGAAPERVLALLKRHLLNTTMEQRLSISGDTRRDLVWTLEELLFRSTTCADAMRLLALLAEAENEQWGNNATGVFCELFHPHHTQAPLQLHERLEILRECADSSRSIACRLLAVKGAKQALERMFSHMLRRSESFRLLDKRPSMTYGELFDYLSGVADLLVALADDASGEVARKARTTLPMALAYAALDGRLDAGMARLRSLVSRTLKASPDFEVAKIAEAVNFVRRELREHMDKRQLSSELRQTIETALQEAESLQNELDGGAMGARIRRWAGEWTREDHDLEQPEGSPRYRYQRELDRIAEEVVADPSLLDEQTIGWLCGPEAQKGGEFFGRLGAVDTSKKWLPKMLELGRDRGSCHALASYCGGLLRHARSAVLDLLAELHRTRSAHPYAIVWIISSLGGDSAGAGRVVELLRNGEVDAGFVERTLVCGRWMEHLDEGAFVSLLQAIAGEDFKRAGLAIDMLGMWIHLGRPLIGVVGEFGWRCLEAKQPLADGNEEWDYDRLAAQLFALAPERGFRLVQDLLTTDRDEKCWNPIDRFNERRAWGVLLEHDRRRALELVLRLCLKDSLDWFRVTWNLQEGLDQVRDGGTLIQLADEHEELAEVIADCLSTARPGFWPIALHLIAKYPSNDRIRQNLRKGVEQLGFVIVGERSAHLESCRADLMKVLADKGVPATARSWLIEVEAELRREIRQETMRELDEDVNGFRTHLEGDNSDLRDWALQRLLRNLDLEEVVRIVGKRNILDTLPRLEFSASERETMLARLEQVN